MPGGRPTKIDEVVIQKLIGIFEIDGTVEEACSVAGISTTSYYNRLAKDEEFRDRMELAQFQPFIDAKRKVKEKGSPALALEFLKARQSERYNPPPPPAIEIHLWSAEELQREINRVESKLAGQSISSPTKEGIIEEATRKSDGQSQGALEATGTNEQQ